METLIKLLVALGIALAGAEPSDAAAMDVPPAIAAKACAQTQEAAAALYDARIHGFAYAQAYSLYVEDAAWSDYQRFELAAFAKALWFMPLDQPVPKNTALTQYFGTCVKHIGQDTTRIPRWTPFDKPRTGERREA